MTLYRNWSWCSPYSTFLLLNFVLTKKCYCLTYSPCHRCVNDHGKCSRVLSTFPFTRIKTRTTRNKTHDDGWFAVIMCCCRCRHSACVFCRWVRCMRLSNGRTYDPCLCQRRILIFKRRWIRKNNMRNGRDHRKQNEAAQTFVATCPKCGARNC